MSLSESSLPADEAAFAATEGTADRGPPATALFAAAAPPFLSEITLPEKGSKNFPINKTVTIRLLNFKLFIN